MGFFYFDLGVALNITIRQIKNHFMFRLRKGSNQNERN